MRTLRVTESELELIQRLVRKVAERLPDNMVATLLSAEIEKEMDPTEGYYESYEVCYNVN